MTSLLVRPLVADDFIKRSKKMNFTDNEVLLQEIKSNQNGLLQL